MQEVDRLSDYYQPEFEKLGFTLVHFKRPGFFMGDGIAIAYRTEAVNLLEMD